MGLNIPTFIQEKIGYMMGELVSLLVRQQKNRAKATYERQKEWELTFRQNIRRL